MSRSRHASRVDSATPVQRPRWPGGPSVGRTALAAAAHSAFGLSFPSRLRSRGRVRVRKQACCWKNGGSLCDHGGKVEQGLFVGRRTRWLGPGRLSDCWPLLPFEHARVQRTFKLSHMYVGSSRTRQDIWCLAGTRSVQAVTMHTRGLSHARMCTRTHTHGTCAHARMRSDASRRMPFVCTNIILLCNSRCRPV